MPVPPWLALLSGLLLASLPARAEEPVWQEPLWLQPPGADAAFPVLLHQPAGWQAGDAAVVVVPAPPGGVGSAALGHRILRALLAAEAAVVELDTIAAWAAVPALSPYPALDAADQPAALRAALLALRAELGAGLLVAVGLGEAGDLALLAIADPVAPPLAAAVALGEAPRFLPGPPPPAAERWPLRAGLLCAALAEALVPAGPAGALRDCRSALRR